MKVLVYNTNLFSRFKDLLSLLTRLWAENADLWLFSPEYVFFIEKTFADQAT